MKIFFTAEYDKKQEEAIKSLGDVTIDGWAIGLPKFSEEELMEKSKDAEIIITSYDDITKNVIENAKNLKLIACTRATPVNIDTETAKEKGIPVIYTPGRNSDSTAEFAIALMLSIARKLPMAYKALKDGEFLGNPAESKHTKEGLRDDVIWDMKMDSPYMVFKGTQLKGKTLGIVGYGSIGKRVGNIARAFGMKLLIFDPYQGEVDIEQIGIEKAETLSYLMKESDFVTLHMKVTENTKKIINEELISLMKETAYLINCSRGAVLDEEAVIKALRNKSIAGAAFDVYASEPLAKNHPFVTELDNVVITPHIAGATNAVLENHTKMIISEVKRFLNNENLLYTYR